MCARTSHLETLDERRLTDDEREGEWRRVGAEVTSLWQTPQVRSRRLEPQDEARNVQWYLRNTLFDVVGEVYARLEDDVGDEYPDVDVPKLFEFRSWAGGDRDGNPFVTPAVTADTLERQRAVVLQRYRGELERLSGVLSQDGSRVRTGESFDDRLAADRERFPGVAREAEEQTLRLTVKGIAAGMKNTG